MPQVSGTVELPTGSNVSLGTLSVRAMGQAIPLTSTAFGIGVSPGSPSLALLTDRDGAVMMAGFLDKSGRVPAAITPRSTAVVLAWFSLGGPFLPANLKSELLALLDADPAMTTLGGVLASRIAANPLAIVQGDAQVTAALANALATLASSGLTEAPPVEAEAVRRLPTFTIVPDVDQAGLFLRENGSATGLDISNSLQRPVRVYVYETQTVTNGVTTNISPARLVAGPFDIGVPASFTPVGGIRTFLSQPAPFHSATIPSIPLAVDPPSEQTTYEVVAIGPSASGQVPGFFSLPRYANAVAGWNRDIDELMAEVYFVECVYAGLLELTGFGSIVPNAPTLVAAGTSASQVQPLPFKAPQAPQLVSQFLPHMSATLTGAFGNDPLTNEMFTSAPGYLGTLQAAALAQVNKIDWKATLQSALDFAAKLGNPLGNYRPNGALTKLFDALASADAGVMWAVTISKAEAEILPVDPSVVPGELVALSISLSSDLTGTYEFEWTSSSADASFSAVGENNTGASITTRQFSVTLQSTIDDTTDINVHVVVYDVSSGHRVQAATASATVRVLPLALISPANPFLSHGHNQTFTVTVSQPVPAGAQYIWSLTGPAGSIGPGGQVTTSSPTVQYSAIQPGIDTLKVQVADANNKLLAKGTTQVNVDQDPPRISVVVSGNWYPDPNLIQEPPNGTYAYTGGQGARIPVDPAYDAVFFLYNIQPNETNSITLTVLLAPGMPFVAGQTFSPTLNGQAPIVGNFRLTLDPDQLNPTNTVYGPDATAGTLTIDSVSQTTEGIWVVYYTVHVQNNLGGVITGTGVGRYQ